MSRINLSYSRISTWKRCLKKYFYKYVDGLTTKTMPSPPRMGSMGHKGIEAFLLGEDWKVAIKKYWREELSYIPDHLIGQEQKEELDLVTNVVGMYLEQNSHFRHPDEKDLIEPETRFEVPIPNTDCQLIGYMDRVIEVPNEGIWLIDHKFTTRSLGGVLEGLEMSEQIDYYIWALTKMFPKKKIMGAIINGVRLKLPATPKVLKSGDRLSKAKITTDYETYYQAIIDNGFDPDDYSDMLTKLEHQDNPFFRSAWIDRDVYEIGNTEKELFQVAIEVQKTTYDIRSRAMGRCSWDCNFQDLCLAEKKGGDVEAIIDEYFEYYKRSTDVEEEEEEEEQAELPF